MSLEEAHEIDPRYEIGDAIEFQVTPEGLRQNCGADG